MVCRHCVAAVTGILERLHIPFESVEIGSAKVDDTALDEETLARLDKELQKEGFERVVDSDSMTVEKIKHAVLHHVRDEEECHLNLSACIEERVGMPYDTLSRIFSQKEGRTIEKYHIAQKIERVKELLGYGQMNLAEIADRTGYSSASHLSRQFKQITGLTPSEYIRVAPDRKPLNEV